MLSCAIGHGTEYILTDFFSEWDVAESMSRHAVDEREMPMGELAKSALVILPSIGAASSRPESMFQSVSVVVIRKNLSSSELIGSARWCEE
ncbi:MAG: hypothetical protein ACI8T1_004103 [Verrucomicrobiales bacterium]